MLLQTTVSTSSVPSYEQSRWYY